MRRNGSRILSGKLPRNPKPGQKSAENVNLKRDQTKEFNAGFFSRQQHNKGQLTYLARSRMHQPTLLQPAPKCPRGSEKYMKSKCFFWKDHDKSQNWRKQCCLKSTKTYPWNSVRVPAAADRQKPKKMPVRSPSTHKSISGWGWDEPTVSC